MKINYNCSLLLQLKICISLLKAKVVNLNLENKCFNLITKRSKYHLTEVMIPFKLIMPLK